MSISTAQDIITTAMQVGGLLGDSEVPSTSQLNFGFTILNMLIDSLAGRALLTSAQIEENFPLIVGQSFYTIGIGSQFNTTKPFEIVSAFVRDQNNLDYNVDVIPRNVYDSFDDKALTTVQARPTNLFYDPGVTQQTTQTGTIKLYPIPDGTSAYTLFITSEKAFTEFSSLFSPVTFPPVYNKMLVYNLCCELDIAYGRPISRDIAEEAHESERIIEQISSRNRKGVAGMSFPGQSNAGYGYNIWSDTGTG